MTPKKFSSTFHWVPMWTFHLISSIHDWGQLWIHLVFLLYFWSCFIGFVNQLGRSFGQWHHHWSKLFPFIIHQVGLFHLFFIEFDFEFHLFPICHSKAVLEMNNDQEALVDNATDPKFAIHISSKMNNGLFIKIRHPIFIENELWTFHQDSSSKFHWNWIVDFSSSCIRFASRSMILSSSSFHPSSRSSSVGVCERTRIYVRRRHRQPPVHEDRQTGRHPEEHRPRGGCSRSSSAAQLRVFRRPNLTTRAGS